MLLYRAYFPVGEGSHNNFQIETTVLRRTLTHAPLAIQLALIQIHNNTHYSFLLEKVTSRWPSSKISLRDPNGKDIHKLEHKCFDSLPIFYHAIRTNVKARSERQRIVDRNLAIK